MPVFAIAEGNANGLTLSGHSAGRIAREAVELPRSYAGGRIEEGFKYIEQSHVHVRRIKAWEQTGPSHLVLMNRGPFPAIVVARYDDSVVLDAGGAPFDSVWRLDAELIFHERKILAEHERERLLDRKRVEQQCPVTL